MKNFNNLIYFLIKQVLKYRDKYFYNYNIFQIVCRNIILLMENYFQIKKSILTEIISTL